MSSIKNVVVLGASYGGEYVTRLCSVSSFVLLFFLCFGIIGATAAQLLSAGIPDNWRVIVVDRNSHANRMSIHPATPALLIDPYCTH
jgi:hypothetical protein